MSLRSHSLLKKKLTLSSFPTGKTSHAAAAPWEGINALDAAMACYNNVSMLRQQMKPMCRIHCTILDGGKRPNIIPERTEMWYFVRGPTDKECAELVGKLKKCAEGAALSTGNLYITTE